MSAPMTFHLRDPFGNVVVLYARDRYYKATLDGPHGYVIASVSHGSQGLSAGYLCAKRYGGDPTRIEVQGAPEMVTTTIGLAWTLLAHEIVHTK